MVHWRRVPFFIYFVLCFFITSSNNAMLHWRRVPFLVHDHTDTESRTMARIAVLCALTCAHKRTKKEQKMRAKKRKQKKSQKGTQKWAKKGKQGSFYAHTTLNPKSQTLHPKKGKARFLRPHESTKKGGGGEEKALTERYSCSPSPRRDQRRSLPFFVVAKFSEISAIVHVLWFRNRLTGIGGILRIFISF